MADQTEMVKVVVEVLQDGARGFADLGEKIKEPGIKAYFIKEAQTRATFAQELETASGLGSDVGGTATGSVHRVWGDVKAALGGGDHTLLETAEQGEDVAKKAYEKALEDNSLSSELKSMLARQQTHILASHDQVKAYRDSTK